MPDEAELPLDGEEVAAPDLPRVTCRLCGRPLTGASRNRGIGAACRAKLHERLAPRPPERPVDQDPLPGC